MLRQTINKHYLLTLMFYLFEYNAMYLQLGLLIFKDLKLNLPEDAW